MTPSPAQKAPIRFERRYDAPIEDLWALWTTKEGFESWWGPEGFRVEVRTLDLCVDGEIFYDMIASGKEQIAFMKQAGMPVSHEVRGKFAEIEPHRRLKITHLIDFVPGVAAYENNVVVEFAKTASGVTMTIVVDAHQSQEWTERAQAGWTSQLTKLPTALAARR